MLLQIGSKGEDVKTLQKKLGITPDGIFGEETKKVVQAFQKAHGLVADGVVGDKTWNALPATVSTTTTTPVTTPTTSTGGTADFFKIVGVIIDNLEGGYYHPQMFKDGRLNASNSSAYSTSGETMFGLDRTAGHSLFYSTPRPKNNVTEDIALIESNAYQYISSYAAEFWGAMDKANAKNTWKWNYKGGDLYASLKLLTGQIMKPYCDSLVNQYLSQNKAIVESDARLAFHFAYACWNGAGWFKKFASDINKAIAAGKTNLDDLANVALNSRLNEGLTTGSSPNALIAQGGEKIKVLFPKLKAGTA
jgi:hypothetical protein